METDINNSKLNNSPIMRDYNTVSYNFKNLPKWFYWVWLIAIISIGLSICTIFISVYQHINWNVEVVSTSIILAFVGIIATFVVISNYSQTRDFKDIVEKRIIEFENTFYNKIKTTEQNFLKIQEDTEFKINVSSGNISKLIASTNGKEGFYINAINSYINAIKCHSQIKHDISFVENDKCNVKTSINYILLTLLPPPAGGFPPHRGRLRLPP